MKTLIKNKIYRRMLFGVVAVVGLIVVASSFSTARNNNFLLANLFNGTSSDIEAVSGKRTVVVQTKKISFLEGITQSISASSVTEPLSKAEVSSKMTGKVAGIYFKEGEWVSAGQTIIQLEQDQTLRTAYNNAQANLINTRTSMNQDIKAAKVATETAKSALENTKVNTQENIKNAELAVKAAEVALENAKSSLDDTRITNEQTVQNCYNSIKTTMQSNLSTINTALTAVGDIIGESPGNASSNDSYEDVLGVKNSQSLRDTKNLFWQARSYYEIAENSYNDLDINSSFNKIDSVVNTVDSALNLTKQTLIQTRILLDNTITCSGFPASSLAGLKTSIDTNLNGPYGINAAISALQANKQAIINSMLGETAGNDTAQSAYEAAKTALEQAKQNLILTKAQAQSQVEAAQKQLESAEANLVSVEKRAELQIAAAQGQLDSIQAQLDNTTITAPISGIVSRKYIEVGEMAMAGSPVAEIVNTRGIEIELSLTEFDIGKVFIGQEVEIRLTAYPDEKFIGKVYYVSSVADPVSKKFPVKIQLENTDERIKAGMVADVKIITDKQKDILVIPKSAVFKEEGVEKIYVVENSKVKIKTVKTEVIDENRLKVVEGLSAGEEIIVNGNYDLEDGDLVTIKNQ